jgi:hypothetical protein
MVNWAAPLVQYGPWGTNGPLPLTAWAHSSSKQPKAPAKPPHPWARNNGGPYRPRRTPIAHSPTAPWFSPPPHVRHLGLPYPSPPWSEARKNPFSPRCDFLANLLLVPLLCRCASRCEPSSPCHAGLLLPPRAPHWGQPPQVTEPPPVQSVPSRPVPSSLLLTSSPQQQQWSSHLHSGTSIFSPTALFSN